MNPNKISLKGLLILPVMAMLAAVQTSSAQDKTAASLPTTAVSFNDVADQALQAMKQRAEELHIKGVAVVAYSEGDTVQAWTSKMVVVG
ncbi:MAG: hypothetical protein ABSC24_09195, partial [Verrucomicrobiota bacterium]